jgi:8-oxo-dGTP pyrophosphatase MutT (NUDIX family)
MEGTAIQFRAKSEKRGHAVRLQYAALPYRFSKAGVLEVLLVTTRRSKRWIIPKGWPIKGLKPAKSAAREAYEEAGVRGEIGAKSIGAFSYDKLIDVEGVTVPCEVKVFPLRVKRQSETWPEIDQRVTQWFDQESAASLIEEPTLKALVVTFSSRFGGADYKSSSRRATSAQFQHSRPKLRDAQNRSKDGAD